jgi:aspartate racemase
VKKIGLIGGMSWQSSLEYYKIINEESNKILGGNSTVESIMYSTDLHGKLRHVDKGEYDILADEFIAISQSLENRGAGVLAICSNTMHIVYDKVVKNVNVPVIHIVDATAQAIKKAGIKKVALLGTTFTMSDDFYKDRLKSLHGIRSIVPKKTEQKEIMRIIEQELTFNILKQSSREYFGNVIKEMKEKGAQGVILGCTEIPLLVKQKDSVLPVFDTTYIHRMAALDCAMNKQ